MHPDEADRGGKALGARARPGSRPATAGRSSATPGRPAPRRDARRLDRIRLATDRGDDGGALGVERGPGVRTARRAGAALAHFADPVARDLEQRGVDEEPTPGLTVDVTTAVLEREILQRGHRPGACVDSRDGRAPGVADRPPVEGRPEREAEVLVPGPQQVGELATGDAARAAGPEQCTHRDADARADGDVLHAHQPGPPAVGHQQVEQHHDEHRERRLPDDEVHRSRRVRSKEHHERDHDPQASVVAADRLHQRTGHPEADERAERGPGARSAPVPSAFDRSTASAPSTTQNVCSTVVVFATSTASARPRPARAALRNRTERRLQWAADDGPARG